MRCWQIKTTCRHVAVPYPQLRMKYWEVIAIHITYWGRRCKRRLHHIVYFPRPISETRICYAFRSVRWMPPTLIIDIARHLTTSRCFLNYELRRRDGCSFSFLNHGAGSFASTYDSKRKGCGCRCPVMTGYTEIAFFITVKLAMFV